MIVRDSSGGSKGWTDFGVHFVDFSEQADSASWSKSQDVGGSMTQSTVDLGANHTGRTEVGIPSVDEAVLRKLDAEALSPEISKRMENERNAKQTTSSTPEYYAHYLRKLLARRPAVPYEPFTHPVACVIAISSQSHAPIETLRELYQENSQRAPQWTGSEYLRYYLLVHDEDHDDISSSTALFNKMKRHFGLHCHLLRIRTVQCGPNDDDGMQLPTSASIPATDEISTLKRKEQNSGIDELQQYLFDTDAAVIRTFVREMVTQSVIPFMEGRVTTWNDQVASKRRGLGGRFMNLSKRFTGFGSTRGSKTTSSTSNSSFVLENGFYEVTSNEAIMHRLADYAFMLRDWKLANSTNDLLRTDFADDKAWYHQARVNEMLAFGMLLAAGTSSSQPKFEAVDQAIENAIYTHATRCADTRAVVRCLTIAAELHVQAGGSSIEGAIRWSRRLLELGSLSPVEQALVAERLAYFYSLRAGSGSLNWDSRARKAAFWNVLTADVWLSLERPSNASSRFLLAKDLYASQKLLGEPPIFLSMTNLWHDLAARLVTKDPVSDGADPRLDVSEVVEAEPDVEIYDIPRHSEDANHRLSNVQLENISLLQRLHDPLGQEDDGFA